MKVVINTCFGGFGLSDEAYEMLHRLGHPIQRYVEQERGPDGLYLPQPANEGEVIFDRELTPRGTDDLSDLYWKYKGRTRFGQRYWDGGWTRDNRAHPHVVEVVEALGNRANGPRAELGIVEVPDDADWTVEEYDGNEHIAEAHRTWR